MAIVAWGTDLRRHQGQFSDAMATRYTKPVRDSLSLRRNAHRVLLTRGCDGTAIYVPDIVELDATYEWLQGVGCREFLPAPNAPSGLSS